MVLKGLYTLLLGIFLTFFVGISITTFYPELVYQTPAPCMAPFPNKIAPNQPLMQGENRNCERAQKEIAQTRNTYEQIVSSLALASAVIFLVVSMTIVRKIDVFSYGFLFGTLFSLLYSILRGLGSNQVQFKFVLICVSLGIVMWIGYIRFVKEASTKR